MREYHKKTGVSAIKRYFLAGIAVILPLFFVGYLMRLLFGFSEKVAGKLINALLYEHYGFQIPGLGLILLLIFIILTGAFSSLLIRMKWFPFIEKIIIRVPLFSAIYPSVKKLSAYLNQPEKGRYKKVVLIEYPSPGNFSIGFITNQSLGRFNEGLKEELICVFVPFPPSPFSGAMVLVDKHRVRILNISVQEATRFIVSGGIIAPEMAS